MEGDRQQRLLRYWPALVFLLMGTLAGAWHNRTVDRGRQDVMSSTVRLVMDPPAGVLSRCSHWVGAQTGWIFRGHSLAKENSAMKARLAELEGENTALREVVVERDRLRADIGFVQSQTAKPLLAQVVACRPDAKFDTIVISRGSLDGVHPHSVVRTPAGLVGQVYEVTPTSSSVALLTAQRLGFGARDQRSRIVGICQGDFSTQIPLTDLAYNADVKVGDRIVTSGLGVVPPGIPIGLVKSVNMDEANMSRSAIIAPSVDFDRLEQVYVLP